MTDPIDPTDALDELASAHLDGATTPEEERRIAGDPALQARVAALRAVREAVRSAPPRVDEERREQAIAAALAAFDEERSSTARVTSLAEVAARRSRTNRLRLVGAAAAVVLLALLVPAISRLDDDEPDTQTALEDSGQDRTATGEAFDAEASSGGAGTTGGSAADDAAGSSQELATTLAAPVELGSFQDLSLLAAAVSAYLREGPPTAPGATTTLGTGATAGDAGVALCMETVGRDAAPERIAFGPASAQLDGRTVVVVALDQGTPEAPDLVVIVRDPADGCTVVATTPLPQP